MPQRKGRKSDPVACPKYGDNRSNRRKIDRAVANGTPVKVKLRPRKPRRVGGKGRADR